ncbi:RsfA family transcriptional regulator [Salirhabdus sp. Marseille-P4669]|uniref:RsfA family transcriptional regulator n=1 Tax=Salirhabdus sp. Marseille-P4669 TaxID=2042310 RepID=UPI000C7C5527|nr:RsfA family transcriptional regulator [Salirhabdus sp. Marseille-P4669]
MAKVRQDAWSHEDDLLLAETVLRHIREGSTQLTAFEEVGDKLNRTAAACGFRWNAEVRRRYEKAIEIAKRQRKEKKRAMANQQRYTPRPTPTYEQTPIPTSSTTIQSNVMESVGQISRTQANGSFRSIDEVISYLKEFKNEYETSYKSQTLMTKLEQDNNLLRDENEKLQQKLAKLEKKYESMEEDYQVLMSIMDKARKMVVFDDDDNSEPKQFRMEKNGNLERVAR